MGATPVVLADGDGLERTSLRVFLAKLLLAVVLPLLLVGFLYLVRLLAESM